MHSIIFSHGFGVTKDSRGFFTDIAAAFPQSNTVLFDYNTFNPDTGEMTLTPFSTQVATLQDMVAQTRATDPDGVIDIVAHSQGCWTTALTKSPGIRKTILLAPPESTDFEQTLARYRDKPGAVIDLDGTTVLPRSDGTMSYIPAQYWNERAAAPQAVALFNTLAETTDVTLIKAAQDTVVGTTRFDGLDERITVLTLDGNHEFGGADRATLLTKLSKILS